MGLKYSQCEGYVADTGTPKGLGVFAGRDFEAGEVVELAPVVVAKTSVLSTEEALRRRMYDWESLANKPGMQAIALGYGSLYNHANPANMRYSAAMDGSGIRFVAAVQIRCGEELTINYNGNGGEPVSDRDNWFEEMGIKPYVEEKQGDESDGTGAFRLA